MGYYINIVDYDLKCDDFDALEKFLGGDDLGYIFSVDKKIDSDEKLVMVDDWTFKWWDSFYFSLADMAGYGKVKGWIHIRGEEGENDLIKIDYTDETGELAVFSGEIVFDETPSEVLSVEL